jgi:hypothetical protein
MSWLLAIDPGPTQSAWLELRDGRPVRFAKEPNAVVLQRVVDRASADSGPTDLAIEMVASYGMPVGADTFETVLWAGRFMQAWCDARGEHEEVSVVRVYRQAVKLHLCGNVRARDSNVRQALIDRFGPGREAAIGRKASPGPLYGVANDVWSALAVAVTAADAGVVVERSRPAFQPLSGLRP